MYREGGAGRDRLAVTVKRMIGVYFDPSVLAFTRYPDGHTVHFVSILFEC